MSDDPGLELDDAVVLLLGAPSNDPDLNGRLKGITRLEKLVFLMERETEAKNWLIESGGFVPYNFGPFSAKVYQAIDMLSAAKIVHDTGSASSDGADSWERFAAIEDLEDAPPEDPYATRDFSLTSRGQRYYDVLIGRLPVGALQELTEFKNRFATLPLRQLVRYVYIRYPEQTEKSIIRDQVLG